MIFIFRSLLIYVLFALLIFDSEALKDYYGILGINKDANQRMIRRVHNKLALKYHPDKNQDKSEKIREKNEKLLLDVNEAYEVLSDPDKRKLYDMGGDPWGGQQKGEQPFQGSHFPGFKFGGGGGQGHGFTFSFDTGRNSKKGKDKNWDIFSDFFGDSHDIPSNHQKKKQKNKQAKTEPSFFDTIFSAFGNTYDDDLLMDEDVFDDFFQQNSHNKPDTNSKHAKRDSKRDNHKDSKRDSHKKKQYRDKSNSEESYHERKGKEWSKYFKF